MTYHGGPPRVRRRKNREVQTGISVDEAKITVNTEELANRVIDAAISAGVSYAIAKTVS